MTIKRLSVRQLRSLIENIIHEAKPMKPPAVQLGPKMTALKAQNDVVGPEGPESRFYGASSVGQLELMAVYDVMTSNGPDVNADRVKSWLPKVRKAASASGTTILDAYESGDELYELLVDNGLFGRRSDKLRDPADRYY